MQDWIKKLNETANIDIKSNKRELLYNLKQVLAPFAMRIDNDKRKDEGEMHEL